MRFCCSRTEETESKKTLVVYYSASGHTKEVAKAIADATEGDLFELEPEGPYSDEDLDWTDGDSRVCREHDNPDERNVEMVAETVENWDEYDTVLIGYPNWWGDLPQPLVRSCMRGGLAWNSIHW